MEGWPEKPNEQEKLLKEWSDLVRQFAQTLDGAAEWQRRAKLALDKGNYPLFQESRKRHHHYHDMAMEIKSKLYHAEKFQLFKLQLEELEILEERLEL